MSSTLNASCCISVWIFSALCICWIKSTTSQRKGSVFVFYMRFNMSISHVFYQISGPLSDTDCFPLSALICFPLLVSILHDLMCSLLFLCFCGIVALLQLCSWRQTFFCRGFRASRIKKLKPQDRLLGKKNPYQSFAFQSSSNWEYDSEQWEPFLEHGLIWSHVRQRTHEGVRVRRMSSACPPEEFKWLAAYGGCPYKTAALGVIFIRKAVLTYLCSKGQLK